MSGAFRRGRWDVPIWTLIGLALFFSGLGGHDLWNPDEPRYAQVAREMAAADSWFVPRLNGEVYSEKPPLMFWAIAASARLLGGLDATAARLPSALAALGALLLVFDLGRRLFGRRAAWMAAAVFASTWKILWQSHAGQIDMLLTFWVTLAMWSWIRGVEEDRPGLRLAFFFWAGIATLTKGPVGLLPPLLAIGAFLALRQDREGWRQLPLGRGLLVWAAVVAAWLAPAIVEGGREYFETIVLKQNVGRYLDPWHHHRPWHYYLTTALPTDFVPWFFILPTALLAGRRRLGEPLRRRFGFLAVWVVVTVVFFSLSPAKRTVYLLPAYPALALLVAAGLDALDRSGLPKRWRWGLAGPFGLLAVGFAGVAAALPDEAARRDVLASLDPATVRIGVGILAAMALALALASWRALRADVAGFVLLPSLGMGALGLGLFLALAPRLEPIKSNRALAETYLALAGPGERWASWPEFDASLVWYTGRPGAKLCPFGPCPPGALRAWTEGPKRTWVFAERDALAGLEEPPALVEVARDGDLADGYVLLTNRPLERPLPP